ncbi:MAG: MutT/nudix family phosphohydrolase [uncultured bacterium (gcode 4)]|uniref:MutT/nudix family phosphohydrolase n=1 Tax=uncultured bacterium (gcode 4) TaxID=1234023 RepID=K2FTA4_9BACT|nr:MAG: MutT/nudix family phosphohydrolase [uncultured bacterium (gcode 4)]
MKRASILVLKDNKILLINRFKDWKQYYVLPGWWVEENESIIEAAIREAKEETNLNIVIDRELFNYLDNSDNRTHHVFLVTEFEWELKLSGPELIRNSQTNRYILEWHNIENLEKLEIYPKKVKDKLSDFFRLNQE